MANYLDTGDTGRAVSAESDGALFAGIFGSAKYVLENGSQFKAEVQSNNIVKISDGDAVMYGRHVRIPTNDSALVTINNGHSGTNRIDLIVFRYTKDSTGKETVDLAVIQGEDSTGTAAAPATIDGDILTGAMQADFPLYRVELNGLNIVSVTAMFDVIGNISQITKKNKDLADKLTELNKNIACSPSVKRQETLVSFQRNQRYKIEHTGQIQFACAFSSTQGYCRIYVYNSSGEIVYREQLNPAPVPSNEVATGQLAVFEGWEFLAESYNALVAGAPKYTLTY